MSGVTSSDPWRSTLIDYNSRLAERLKHMGLQAQRLGGTGPSVLVQAMEELSTAAEELRAGEEELGRQASALAAMEVNLDAARRHYQDLFDFAPDAYLVTNRGGVIVEANQATSALVGYARTYVVGKPLIALLDPASAAGFAARLEALQSATDERVQTWELELRPRRTGAPVRTSVRVAPMRDRSGEVLGFRWLLRDVSEQRSVSAALSRLQAEQEAQLRTRTMELEAILRMKDAMRTLDHDALRAAVTVAGDALERGGDARTILAGMLTTLRTLLEQPAAEVT